MLRGISLCAALAGALLVAACTTTNQMERYVGGDVGQAILDYGSPTEVFRLSSGQRAYQWEIKHEGFRPAPGPRVGVGVGIGTGVFGGQVTTVNTSYVPYSKTCRYTLIADPVGDDWIVTDVRRPMPGCG